jgi:anti-sigma regulatory factor (Ser/Thr protein kinase)
MERTVDPENGSKSASRVTKPTDAETSYTRVFPARLTALPQVAAFIAETGAHAGVPAGPCQKLTVLVEELFTNTVVHGHRRESDEPVQVQLEVGPGRFTLTYEDTAPPHDPFASVERPDEAADVEERPVGGLGVLLVATLARDVEYRRVEGKNRIRLVMVIPT